jgi:hypothetical protein
MWKCGGIIYHDWIFTTSTKNKIVTLNNKLNIYIQRRFNVYILEIKVRIMCNGASFDGGTIWKPWHFNSNGFIKP